MKRDIVEKASYRERVLNGRGDRKRSTPGEHLMAAVGASVVNYGARISKEKGGEGSRRVPKGKGLTEVGRLRIQTT